MEEKDEEKQVEMLGVEYDLLLQIIVESVSGESDYEPHVILNLRGALVSGTIISFDDYLKSWALGAYDLIKEKMDSISIKDELPIYIHLKDAEVKVGNSIIQLQN